MGIDINTFNAAKERARKMIHNDAQNDAHIIKERQMDRDKTYRSLKGVAAPVSTGFDSLAPSYGSNGTSISALNESSVGDDRTNELYSAIDNKMNTFMENRKQQNMQSPTVFQAPTQVNKNLPKEILESFSNNYIDQSALSNSSVLDTIGATSPSTNYQSAPLITESAPAKATQGGGIDYELIKNIVEGAVKKYVNALGKKMLTESVGGGASSIKAVQFAGDKFVFITKSGDMFESKLTFVKNVNKK